MKLAVAVARNVKSLRIQAGLTQQQLADKAGLNIRYINKIENEVHNLTLESLEALATGLKVSPVELLYVRFEARNVTPKVALAQVQSILDIVARGIK